VKVFKTTNILIQKHGGYFLDKPVALIRGEKLRLLNIPEASVA